MMLILGLLALDAAGVAGDAAMVLMTGSQSSSIDWTKTCILIVSCIFLNIVFFPRTEQAQIISWNDDCCSNY